ncbi:TetR family transcriptional regulator [Mycobacterium antarcticum]|uniref:TetR/AcrR family transcriptional regulator n=1 Tax=Mycolicibacterium sp. TUM20983 TaxID=3023369 RepID=UPI00238B266B|nr:TetR/AcrR family transcriptional regulator [Mycolicibacterium sp. TUM20983]GLP76043.1 TetR family transcriptional regulator [Mycolicibacterium sp. TUM20983]
MTSPLRSDARSNRDQILAAAEIVFREQGVDVPMKMIADRAGVGVGTLYRRFPNRTALIGAAGHEYLRGLANLAETTRDEAGGAWPGLCRLLRECAELRLGALASALEPTLHAGTLSHPNLTGVRTRVADRVVALTAQAQADGDLRPDVTPQDVANLMTLQIYVRPGESYAEAARRTMDIVLDGLSPRRRSP